MDHPLSEIVDQVSETAQTVIDQNPAEIISNPDELINTATETVWGKLMEIIPGIETLKKMLGL